MRDMKNNNDNLPNVVEIPGNYNTRHFGGYTTDDGRTVMKEKLIRSGQTIGFQDEDIRILLDKYNLKRIVDFRTVQEMKGGPSLHSVPGTHYVNMDLLGGSDGLKEIAQKTLRMAIHKKTNEEEQKNMMALHRARDEEANKLIYSFYALGGTVESIIDYFNNSYVTIINSTRSQSMLRQLFDMLLIDDGGCTFFHCVGGKDRTGVAAALILSSLGVSWDKCLEDYLLSNKFFAKVNKAKMCEVMEQTDNPEVIEGIRFMMDVDLVYMERIYEFINSEYGSLDEYLSDALLLTTDKTARLREIYTE